MPTCPSTPADMPASSFSPFSPGSSCFQPDSEPPSLLLPGGPPGCQDPVSSTHRSPSPGGPSCRQTAGVRPVPTSLLPGTCLGPGRLPSSCSFPGSLTRPGWLTPAVGSPCPPPRLLALFWQRSVWRTHIQPRMCFSRLLLFLDTEV